ncbi:uncharacterized protein FPRO_06545 [Fusarium proliferatum ET1]|uniref:Uncharacterized protein n=1 Tax=Fusarium proliferatum (strain ET1) TaxID=1227346 RepID=A0A1L7VD88_FUSPR|nr:uncharacterized protein FPRO_06545 [Fusarium proliferatum ET1]CZR38264.1 uncharacterized protein FPRO_06545 [Fusarium proliferatum ET1]
MADTRRAEWFLSKASLQPPPRLGRLTEPPAQDFLPFSTTNRDAARQLLVQQRTSDPNYKPPDRQKRHLFRSKEQKAEACDTSQWSFTKHEVAKAFNALLAQEILPPAGVAQALLLHTTLTSLDELWGHLNDAQLEKRMKRNRMSEILNFDSNGMTWLDTVTSRDNFNYVHLLCQTQASQGVLNRAFGMALSRSSLESMKLLLSFGAVASDYQDLIGQHIRARNLDLVRLLLSAPNSMAPSDWKACLEQDFARVEAEEALSLSFILLLLSHRPELVSESFLLSALRLESYQATAVMLGYAYSNQVFFAIRHQVCEIISQYQNGNQRLAFFTLLSHSGLVGDNLVTREELVKEVLARHLPLVKLLVHAGVAVDVPPHNALKWAVSQLDFDTLEILRHGTLSLPASQVLSYLPDNIPEPDLVHFMNIFGSMGLGGQQLDSCLVRAAQRKQQHLVQTLLHYGASVEAEEAAAIRAAIISADLYVLSLLLQGQCAPAILSTLIPTAMEIPLRTMRFSVMQCLIKKGVEGQSLGTALLQLLSEEGNIDSDLTKLLIDNGAPLDCTSDVDASPLVQAIKKGDVTVLNMLCSAKPTAEALAAALPFAFSTIAAFGYDVALELMTLLLKQGASGPPLNETFLKAIASDVPPGFVQLLTEHGADVNYSSGQAFVMAIEMDKSSLLELLCSSSPPTQATVTATLPKLIEIKHYSLSNIELFLSAASRATPKPSLTNTYALTKDHPQRSELLPCLLRHGLDINEESGMILCLAVREHDMDLIKSILALDPSIATLSNAFREACQVEDSDKKLDLMELLLKKASPAEIGQSKALLQETQAALDGNMDGLWLLLGHKANVNFNNGEAVQAAASNSAGYPIILNMLLSAGATDATVEEAFDAASNADTPASIKTGIFGSLFAFHKDISVEIISRAFVKVLESHPEDEHLYNLLLEHGAGAQVQLATLEAAAETSPGGLFQKLLRQVSNSTMRNEIFEYIRMHTTISSMDRHQAYETLLKQGIDKSQMSEALVVSIRNEPSNREIPLLLLNHGAQVNYKNNEAFAAAFQSRNLEMFELLCCYLVKGEHDEAAKLVFEHPYLRENPCVTVEQSVRANIYRSVLTCNIDPKSIYTTLVHFLDSPESNLAIVELLLEHGADPNDEDGHCFYLAARHKEESHFRSLCKHADLSIVLPTISRRIVKEHNVTRWFKICFEMQPSQIAGLSDQLLYQCIRKFPTGTDCLDVLLGAGLSPSATITYRLHKNWEEEEISLLMWCLVSPLKTGNNVILKLLEHGGKGRSRLGNPLTRANYTAALPDYVTPDSKIPTIFLTLLNKSRAPVLEALLKLDGTNVLNQTISGSKFSSLASYPKKPKLEFTALFEDEDEIPPREASLFLGNLDAFKLLNSTMLPDDGTLHLAALLALPDFTDWLLSTHEPNYEEENFGFMVPLALTCYSKPFPWCKVANEEQEWFARLEETIKILIPKTLSSWRYRQKLPLHLALENGSQVTMAMLNVLNARGIGNRDKYLYTDKTGMQYSPCEYVEVFVEVDDDDKMKLVKILQEHGLN